MLGDPRTLNRVLGILAEPIHPMRRLLNAAERT